MFGKLTQGAVFAQAGLMTPEVLGASLPLAGLALVVMFLGMRMRDRMATYTYRRWLRRLLVVLAAILMIQFFNT